MKIIGIIAEYNPFHNGHAYQIEAIRRQTGADYIIAAMSGDFVQRGEPAVIDKYARAKMALSCGADLVVELPALWATASAESFAMAGVTLFDRMGCVDGLCFGAETDDLALLLKLADILTKEPEAYKKALSSYIKEGLNFPSARARAIAATQPAAFSTEMLNDVLNNPNNILAIEYLKALKRRSSAIKPMLLKREGAAYHETTIRESKTDAFKNPSPSASATAIRQLLARGGSESGAPSALADAMPPQALAILTDYLSANPIVRADDFSQLLGYLLLHTAPEQLAGIGDCNAELANRLKNNRTHFLSFDAFCAANKSRDITYTRMSRVLLHLILAITNDDYRRFGSLDQIPYLRVLGFRKASAALFQAIQAHTAIPLITKLAAADTVLSGDALRLLEKDIFAADLYEQIKAIKKRTTWQSEYARQIVRV